MWVLSLGWEAPPEEGMTTHFSILSWRIPWTEEPNGLQSMGSHRVGRDRVTWHTYFWKIKLFPGGSRVKNLPAVPEIQETLVQFLCQKHPLEKKMAMHANILFFQTFKFINVNFHFKLYTCWISKNSQWSTASSKGQGFYGWVSIWFPCWNMSLLSSLCISF